jgi:hypothetical protein
VVILIGSSKTPETAITLISEFIPNTKIYEFNNYKESECYESYNLLIFLLIYNNQNTYYNPNNETSLFLKCENIDAMFEKIKELSNIINQPLNTMKYELLKLYPESKQLF